MGKQCACLCSEGWSDNDQSIVTDMFMISARMVLTSVNCRCAYITAALVNLLGDAN